MCGYTYVDIYTYMYYAALYLNLEPEQYLKNRERI